MKTFTVLEAHQGDKLYVPGDPDTGTRIANLSDVQTLVDNGFLMEVGEAPSSQLAPVDEATALREQIVALTDERDEARQTLAKAEQDRDAAQADLAKARDEVAAAQAERDEARQAGNTGNRRQARN